MDGHKSRYNMSSRGGGIYTLQNIGVHPQLQIMEILWELISVVRSENLL